MKIWQVVAMAVLLTFSVALSGCGDEVGPLTMPPGVAPQNGQKAEKLAMDIYWDATISMEGFTKLAAGNVYRSLPDILGDMGSALGEAHFFRFGKEVTPVEGRDYRRFSNPECYTELETYFGNVLEEANPEHLSIVVTDLFESEADWSNVTQKLREKYFSRHLSVAVIGIKNSFSGKIYDVGLNAAAFDYDSGDDPARYRPFYLFLMGPESQLRLFLEEWERKQLAASEMKYVVFSEQFTPQAQALRVGSATDTKNLFENAQLPKEDDRLQEVGIGERKEKVEITIPFSCRLDSYTCLKKEQLVGLEERVKIFVWQQNESEEDEGAKGEWQELEGRWEEQAGNHVSFACSGDEQEIRGELNMTFSPGTLPLGKVGAVQVQLIPTRQSLTLPDWVSAWDMGNIDVQPELFDGAKTVNLERIAASLKDSLLVAAHPTIAELYLVVDGR